MSDFHRLRAELDRSNRLLALAEDLILGYRTGLIRVETQAEGAWTREGDGAGLREMLDTLDREEKEKETTEGQAEDEIGRGEDDWGMTTWISSADPTLRSRIVSLLAPFVGPKAVPSLPAEILRHIFSFADVTSLPNSCLVNSTFREIASPLLYSELVLRSPAQLAPFLEPAASPRFALDRHIFTTDRTIHVNLHAVPISSDWSPPPTPTYPAYPFPSFRHLSLTFSETDIPYPVHPTTHPLEYLLISSSRLISPLNPTTLIIDRTSTNPLGEPPTACFQSSSWSVVSQSWHALARVISRNCIPTGFPEIVTSAVQFLPWLWSTSDAQPIPRTIFDLSESTHGPSRALNDLLFGLEARGDVRLCEFPDEFFPFTLWVGSEEERRDAEREIGKWEEGDWNELVSVEVERDLRDL